jgi:hypothetical protein
MLVVELGIGYLPPHIQVAPLKGRHVMEDAVVNKVEVAIASEALVHNEDTVILIDPCLPQ